MRKDFSGFFKFVRLSFALCSGLLVNTWSQAAILQIIHTNDLHSHFEHGENSAQGNYAALKYTIDALKAQADEQNIESIVVDAGDFSEGSQFYLVDRGEASWTAMNLMGYDAVTIGNHDYLMGFEGLNRVIVNTKPDFALLGANFVVPNKYREVKKAIKPRIRLERNGQWITIMGLTLRDSSYSWVVGESAIGSEKRAIDRFVPGFRKDSDFVILLSHLGHALDLLTIKQTEGIDLVIGGHSDDVLFQPKIAFSKDKKPVPILQAGKNGHYVGELLVDLVPGKAAKILRYRLVPVYSQGKKDQVLEKFINNARRQLEEQYSYDWLYEPLGISEVPITKPAGGYSAWGDVVNEGMKFVTNADLAINSAALFGDDLEAGTITRERLIQYYPRVFEFTPFTTGWKVWSGEVEGWILRQFLQQAVRQGFDVSLAGGSFKTSGEKGSQTISHFRVGGQSACNFCVYKIALPEGIARVVGNDYYYQRLIDRIRPAPYSILQALEIQLKRRGGVVR